MTGSLTGIFGGVLASLPLKTFLRQDTFVRPDQTSLGTPSDGGSPWLPNSGPGDIGITSDTATARTGSGGFVLLDAAATVSKVTCGIEATLTTNSTWVAMVDAAGNAYAFFFTATVAQLRLFSGITPGGTGSSIATLDSQLITPPIGTPAALVMTVIAGVIEVTLNGVHAVGGSDSSVTPTQVGLRGFDNVGSQWPGTLTLT